LQAVAFPEALLHGVKLAIAGQALDGGHFSAVGLHRQDGARLHRLAVEQHGAGTTQRRFAADMSAGKLTTFAEELDQKRARFDFMLLLNAVDFEFYQTFHAIRLP
jgi:hypothetical protein